jgi:hypothetical protein
MFHKISRGNCPQYFESYFTYVNTVHKYNTRSANNKLVLRRTRAILIVFEKLTRACFPQIALETIYYYLY